jgi:glycosyltransferase involved in cell wall biosynthesis
MPDLKTGFINNTNNPFRLAHALKGLRRRVVLWLIAQLPLPSPKGYSIYDANILEFPFAPEQFDIVICIGIIQSTADTEQAMFALCKQVKPGGLLVFNYGTYGYAARRPRRTLHVVWLNALKIASLLVNYRDAYPPSGPKLLRVRVAPEKHDPLPDHYASPENTNEIRTHLQQCGMENIEAYYAENLTAEFASKRLALDEYLLLKMPGFDHLLKKIASREIIYSDDVLPFLCHESKEDRLWTNYRLAEAFHLAGNTEQAKVFIQRVWMFSGFDEEYFSLFIDIHAACGDVIPICKALKVLSIKKPGVAKILIQRVWALSGWNEKYLALFISIHAACDDVDSIREVHKALGMKKSDANKIAQALNHFNAWQNSYAVHRKIDEYHYDFEILDRIALLAKPHAFPVRQPHPIKNRKIRLAYLMFGMLHINSVIVKISLLFAKYHDPLRFEVTFYVPEQSSDILKFQEAVENIGKIQKCGWNVVLAPDSPSEEESLIGVSRLIYESNPDILITNAGLADLKHYFITALRPAPLVIGLCQGPLPQFIAPNFNWSIAWFKSLVIDCPIDCSLVKLRLDLPVRKYNREELKSYFGIPTESLVVMISGRPAKLQDVGFLKALINLISSHPNIYLVVVGLGELPSNIHDQLKPDFSERIKVFGWVDDFQKVLSMADIVVDTYPSGGGVVIKDAMALGTPVVSFKHDHMKMFSQTEWSVAEEVIGMPELLIERGDFVALKKILSKLLTDHQYRKNLSALCKERINETSGNPEQMVKSCEQIYLGVVRTSL